MSNKNKLILGGSVLGVLLVAGVVVKASVSGFSWLRVEDKVADRLVLKVESPEVDEVGDLGAATVSRTGNTGRQASGAFDSATSTFGYWTNNTGRTVIIDQIALAFDADDGIFLEKLTPTLIVATSSKNYATSTLNSEIIAQTFTTSTAVQHIASSTFGQAWRRWVANGESIVIGWSGGMGASTTWNNRQTPSSTGSFAIDFFLK